MRKRKAKSVVTVINSRDSRDLPCRAKLSVRGTCMAMFISGGDEWVQFELGDIHKIIAFTTRARAEILARHQADRKHREGNHDV